MRVVLDTNVIISATLVHGGKEDQILRAWQRGAFELVLSPPILEELARALFYEKLRRFRWMTDAEIGALLLALGAGSFLASGEVTVRVSRDPDDDKFLAAAVDARARFLVTGDRDLLDLKRYQDIRILRPGRFLAVLRRASPRGS